MAADLLHRCRALLAEALIVDAAASEVELRRAEARLAAGQPADRMLAALERRLLESGARVAARSALAPRLQYPAELPVSGRRDEVLTALAAHRVLVLTGETGSGKTTQLPKMLWEAGGGRRGLIGITQPRRVAATSVAARLREEMALDETRIAHAVRFDDRAGADCLIRVMTDGLLLAEASRDRHLARYDTIIIDEAHERSLTIDVLLGLLHRLVTVRSDLRLVITSATIEVERFSAFFGGAPIIEVGGRTWPVEVRYRQAEDEDLSYLPAAIQTVRSLHESEGDGDVLVFLPTERDILEARKRLDLPGASVLPCFGRLNAQEQNRIFAPVRGRKIVLATNIAETSLTVPGIRFVVDAGLARVKRYSAASRTERLPIEAVSQASAAQRAGRAGRLGPGICLRLYGEADYLARPAFTQPEIQRSNLAGVALMLLDMGLGDPEDFAWVDPPAAGAWGQARQLLHELGAVSRSGQGATVTPLGRRMARLSCDVQVARMLLAGVEAGVAHEVCAIAAFLSVQDPRQRPPGKEGQADAAHDALAHEAGDLMAVLNLSDLMQAQDSMGALRRLAEARFLSFRRLREWSDVRHQLWRQLAEMKELGVLPEHGHEPAQRPIDRIHRAVLAGMLPHVARWDEKERCYRTPGNRQAWLHPGSALIRILRGQDGKKQRSAPWLVACEQVETSRTWLRLAAPIDPQWIIELAGDRLERRVRDPHFDPSQGRVVCTEALVWKGLPLVEGRRIAYAEVDPAAATRMFIEQALVDEQLRDSLPVLGRNAWVRSRCRELAARLRDPALLPQATSLVERYATAFGAAVIADARSLRTWLKEHGEAGLSLREEDLLPAEAVARAAGFPDELRLAGREFSLRYRHAPGSEDDGVTVEMSEADLPLLAACDPSRVVPGLLEAQVLALLSGLPKDLRRRLIPLAEAATRLAAAIRGQKAAVPRALAAQLVEELRCRPAEVLFAPLPPELCLRVVVKDGSKKVLHQGRDLAQVLGLAGLRPDPLAVAREAYDSQPAAEWPGDEVLPERVGDGEERMFPALLRCRDARAAVAVRRTLFASREAAGIWHRDGLEALLEAALEPELDRCARGGGVREVQVVALGQPLGALHRQYALALAATVLRGDERDPLVWFERLEQARRLLGTERARIDRSLVDLGDGVHRLDALLKRGTGGPGALSVLTELRRDRERLLGAGWLRRLPWPGLLRLPVYVQGLLRRWERPGGAEPQAARRERLLAAWEGLHAAHPPRLLFALGGSEELRRGAVQLEETLLEFRAPDLAKAGSGPAQPALEGAVVQVCWNLGKAAERSRKLDRDALDRLLDVRPALERVLPGPRRDGLLRQLDLALRDHPDLSLGCDLVAQQRALHDLLRQIGDLLER